MEKQNEMNKSELLEMQINDSIFHILADLDGTGIRWSSNRWEFFENLLRLELERMVTIGRQQEKMSNE